MRLTFCLFCFSLLGCFDYVVCGGVSEERLQREGWLRARPTHTTHKTHETTQPYLDVEERVLVDVVAKLLLEVRRKLGLLRRLDRAPLLLELLVVGERAQALELLGLRDPAVAAELAGDERRELGVAEREPAARRDAVGLVLEPVFFVFFCCFCLVGLVEGACLFCE